LVGVLTLTSALLLALAPAPLRPDASSSLFAVDTPESMAAIFQTQVPPDPKDWKYIYIHHSGTRNGSALTLGQGKTVPDHFVIGNGDGAIDGQIQIGQRWDQQLPAQDRIGSYRVDSSCVSICLIGDFDRTVPTPTQLRQLAHLVNTLQAKLDIPRGRVVLLSEGESAAGIGRYFPATAFRQQLIP
jgi:hypothetical protein